MEELRKDSGLLHSQIQEMYRSVSSEQRSKILDWTSTVKYEDAHRQRKRQAMQHTADWLLKHPRYLAWVESGTDGALWLTGYMGSGKSCLVHAVIEDLRSQLEASSPRHFRLAYYYCDGSDAGKKAEMASVEKILCVLVKQLAAADPDARLSTNLLSLYEKYSHESDGLNKEQCLAFIVSMAALSTGIKIVIDGLNACEAGVQSDFCKTLQYLTQSLNSKCKLFIACRPHLNDMLRKLTSWIINVPDHNREAIELMIRNSVGEAVQDPRLMQLYRRGTERLDDQVAAVLISNAGGMYRWVDMALAYLHHLPAGFREMKARLQRLPHLTDLYGLYDQMWEEHVGSLGLESQEVVETAILLLIYGVETGSTRHRHILEACTFVEIREVDFAYTVSGLIALCPGFLVQSEGWEASDSSVDSQDSKSPAKTIETPAEMTGITTGKIATPHVSVTD